MGKCYRGKKMLLMALSASIAYSHVSCVLLARPSQASNESVEVSQESLHFESDRESVDDAIFNDLSNEYRIGPGDTIQIDIFNHPELNGRFSVLVDGSLRIPLIGSVAVEGFSLSEVEKVLAERYLDLLVRYPLITVTLLNPRPVRVVVAGEVNRPGTYTIEINPGSESTASWPSLTDIIQTSGGITQQANIRNVEIRRPQSQGDTVVIQSNLWTLIRDGELEQDIILRDGDRVFVPTAINSPSDSVEIASATFSPSSINVQVVGEVPRAGSISLPPNASLNQAILAAGGLTDARARKSSVQLIRLNSDGTLERREYDVDFSAPPNDQSNPILRPDDVIIVDRNTIAQSSDFLRLLLSPIAGAAAIFRLFGLEL